MSWNEVASVDPATGEPTPAVVTATPVTLFEGTIYDITVDPGEPGGGDETTISATGEHPFLVARAGARATSLESRVDPDAVALVEPLDTVDGRWVPARDLAEGDTVRTMSADGVAGTATVANVRARHAVAPVYNLTVRGTSRYLVGACGVVVHNKDPGGGKQGTSFFEGTRYSPEVIRKMNQGVGEFHSFPESVRSFESLGTVRSLKGGDGVVRQILEIRGSYPNPSGIWRDGVFEFIRESDGLITHRFFRPSCSQGP